MKTADPELMRAINRFHVMDAIRREGPISRVEICSRSQLSPTTVSAITASLLDDRLIVPRQLGDVRDVAGRGRPRVMLELNPIAAFVVGVKLAPDQITVATTDFCADVLATVALPIRISRQPVSVIADLVEDAVRRCVNDARLRIDAIAGLCVGLPGVIEHSAGVVRQSPIFREEDVPFAAALQDRLGISTAIDSDVNLRTIAENWFGKARGLDDFLVVSVEHSLGLGIMHKGDLFRGANGMGPHLGDLLVGLPQEGVACRRLDAIASEAAILAEALMLLEGTRHRDALRNGHGMDTVIALAREGDVRLIRILSAAGEALGFAISNLIALFAPAKVLLAGAAIDAGELLLGPLRDMVARLVPPGVARATDITVHRGSNDTWARGAAALTLRDLYGAPWSTTGPAGFR